MQSFNIEINEPDVVKVPTFTVDFFINIYICRCLSVIQTRSTGRGAGGGLLLFSKQTFYLNMHNHGVDTPPPPATFAAMRGAYNELSFNSIDLMINNKI